jgi:hypothetical protein
MGTEVGMRKHKGGIEKNGKHSFDWYVTPSIDLLKSEKD